MKKRNLVAVLLMLGMSLSLFVGCAGGNEVVAEPESSEVTSVAEEDTNSEVESEAVSGENTEEVSEEISEEVVEAVDFSITAIDAKINEITQTYPSEDSRQIAAVVIGTNAKYMTEEEIEEVLNAYQFTEAEVNELFIEYFETKGAMIIVHDQILEGSSAPTPNYTSVSPIYLYCLNSEEYEECVSIETFISDAFDNNVYIYVSNEFEVLFADAESKSIAKMLVLASNTSTATYYPECLPFETE